MKGYWFFNNFVIYALLGLYSSCLPFLSQRPAIHKQSELTGQLLDIRKERALENFDRWDDKIDIDKLEPVVIDDSCSFLKDKLGYDDPLACYQWHLVNAKTEVPVEIDSTSNLETDTFSTSGMEFGADIQSTVLMSNFSGRDRDGNRIGVWIADSGITARHEDLEENVRITFDMESGKIDGRIDDAHGTSVASIIGAAANDVGGVGIAPEVRIGASNPVNMDGFYKDKIDPEDDPFPQLDTAYQVMHHTPGYDVWNGSFGLKTCELGINPRAYDYLNTVTLYAQEFDSVYVLASGNSRQDCGENASLSPIGNFPQFMYVASVDAGRAVASYSSRGPNISVAGFGGVGVDSNTTPGVCTATDNGGDSDYTCKMKGTSAAAPTVSGVLALLRQSNPALKWHDWFTVIHQSALPIAQAKTIKSKVSGIDIYNYSVNSAGYKHSVDVGFGVIDGDKALLVGSKHKVQPAVPKRFSEVYAGAARKTSDAPIKIKKGKCAQKVVTIGSGKVFDIFSFEASFKIDSKAKTLAGLNIQMSAPDKTKSQLLSDENRIPSKGLTHDNVFKSLAPFATDMAGNWVFRVCSAEVDVIFDSVQIDAFGFDTIVIPDHPNKGEFK